MMEVKMKQRQIVLLNIAEAREQLEEIGKALLNQDYEEVELQIHLLISNQPQSPEWTPDSPETSHMRREPGERRWPAC